MGRRVLGLGLPVLGGQEKGCIDDADLRSVEVIGQPFGGDERPWVGVIHGAGNPYSIQSGTGRLFSLRNAGLNSLLM